MTTLTSNQQDAALLLAQGDLSDVDIAARCGVHRNTINRWQLRPEFQAAVSAHIEELGRKLSRYHIARKDKRMAAYQRRWEKMHALIDARADDLKDIPGGDTGLLVRQFKMIGTGPLATMVEEYVADTALQGELRQLEKQAAQEAGQWTEKRENRLTDAAGDDVDLRALLSTPIKVEIVNGVNPFDQ